jgi:hypothetical protein
MLMRWRSRHADDTSIRRWAAATTEDARRQHAFAAIVHDPGTLIRMDYDCAAALVSDAARRAAELRAMADGDGGSHLVAAAEVRDAVARWRDATRDPAKRLYIGARTKAQTEAADAGRRSDTLLGARWEKAREDHPRFDELSSSFCLLLASEMPGTKLALLDEPWGGIVALGALRQAAWARRQGKGKPKAIEQELLLPLSNVERWCAITSRDPFRVPLEIPGMAPAELAIELALDARAASDLASRLLSGGLRSDGAKLWGAASDRLAREALARDPGLLASRLDRSIKHWLCEACLRVPGTHSGDQIALAAREWLAEHARPPG